MAYSHCLAITTDRVYDDEHERSSIITALINDMVPSLL